MVTYGGDEVNALVFDMGTTSTRAGYAGEDTPRVMFPTSYGVIEHEQDTVMTEQGDDTEETEKKEKKTTREYYIGDINVNKWRSDMEIRNPLKDGLVEDWEAVEHIWETTFKSMLRINPEEHPLLCTEPAWNTKDRREKTMELAFEKFAFPAFYLTKDAVMTAFSAGRATALVLDSGGGKTSAVPVYDGFVLNKGILHQSLAGNTLVDLIKEQLRLDLNYAITPQYKIAKREAVEMDEPPKIEERSFEGVTTDSFNEYQTTRVVNEYKESVCQISDVTFDEGLLESKSKKTFEFSDGFSHAFGIERFKIPETLFQTKTLTQQPTESEETPAEEDTTITTTTTTKEESQLSIHDMVYKSINNCDVDLRPLLFNNVVVTGGNTLFPGFNERLNYELPLKAPGSKIKIHSAGSPTERKSSSWLGGSILASLGTFHQLWVSRAEYQEFGASIVHRKC
ncbi:Actin/actin-like protein [Backusella circina FSU 941]|nr:Actin/actin-like protein [Backusella circina FSU 941]